MSRRGRAAGGALVLAALAASLAWADPRPVRLLILPFDNPRGDASVEHLEEALPALLASALARSDRHAVVDRRHLDQVLAELALTLEGLIAPTARREAGRLLGATTMIGGSVVRLGPDLLVTLRAVDVETGRVTAAAEARGPAGQPGRLVGELYGRLTGEPDRRLPALRADQIDEAPESSLHFMRGLGYHFSGRYNQALAEFLQAAREETLTDLSRLWLANAYLAQQQYAHAYLELRRLGPGAPSRSRRAEVDAKLRECERHLDPEAIRTIRDLAARAAPPGGVLVLPRSDVPQPHRFFGGRTVTVPLVVHASEAGQIALHAQLVQLTAGLAVPIGAGIEVAVPIEPSLPADAGRGSGIELALATPLPAVTREAAFELWIRARRGGQTVGPMAGRIALRVYPDDLLGPVRRWAAAHPLRLADDQGTLTDFLHRQGIPVVGAAGAPGGRARRTVTLHAGPEATRKGAQAPVRAGEAVVLFTERQTDLPRVLIERAGGGMLVTVDMRLLDRLAADPLAQRILLEVLELVHEDRPLPGGDVP